MKNLRLVVFYNEAQQNAAQRLKNSHPSELPGKASPGHLDSPDVESCPKWKLSEMQMSPVWMLLAMFASHFQQPSRRKALEASLCLPKKHLSCLLYTSDAADE